MTGLVIFIHVIVCALLILVILMQQGRGGGLTENFASVESIFGAKTNETLIKGTTILATLFLFTCLILAFLSSKRSQSLMSGQNVPAQSAPQNTSAPVPESAAPQAQQEQQAPKEEQEAQEAPKAEKSPAPVKPAAPAKK